MRCPYCGAEATGRKCTYCGSDLLEFLRQHNLSVEDFEPDRTYESKDNAIDKIRELCNAFIKKHEYDFASYDSNGNFIAGTPVKQRLFDILQIPKGSEVFLIHDDTLFSSGKNGFAITNHGFHCLELLGSYTFTGYETITPDDVILKCNQVISLNEESHTLTYYSAAGKVHEELDILCRKIFNELN